MDGFESCGPDFQMTDEYELLDFVFCFVMPILKAHAMFGLLAGKPVTSRF